MMAPSTEKKKNAVKVGPPLTKLSGSAYGVASLLLNSNWLGFTLSGGHYTLGNQGTTHSVTLHS